jgi:exodeoxyribonuclease VII small subunit
LKSTGTNAQSSAALPSLTLIEALSNVPSRISEERAMAIKKPATIEHSSDQASPPTPDFERAMAELEAVVERLEQGELPLEQALSHFERGVQLTGACQAALKAAEQKVEILLRKSGVSEVSAFESQDVDPDVDDSADDASDDGS